MTHFQNYQQEQENFNNAAKKIHKKELTQQGKYNSSFNQCKLIFLHIEAAKKREKQSKKKTNKRKNRQIAKKVKKLQDILLASILYYCCYLYIF